MAVVINEFEVVPAQTADNQIAAQTAKQSEPAKPEPSDYELEKMLERSRERSMRVETH